LLDDHQLGYVVCKNCGEINDNIIDSNPEWRNYDDGNKNNARCGKILNPLLPRSSLGTQVHAYGRIKIIHTWNSMPYKERSLNLVFKRITNTCQGYDIPKKIEDDAKIMYKMISERKHTKGKNKGKYIITRGRNRDSIIAAAVFFACRRNQVTRSPKEVAKMFALDETDLSKGAKNFLKLIKMKAYDNNMGTSKTIDFVLRKCNDMNIKSKYTKLAIKIAENIDKLNIATTHTPYSMAAASILLMAEICGISSITKSKLEKVFETSSVTIGKAYSKIDKLKDILINDHKVDEILEDIKKKDKKFLITQEVYDRMVKFNIDTSAYTVEGSKEHKEQLEREELEKKAKKTKQKITATSESDELDLDIESDSYDNETHEATINDLLKALENSKINSIDFLETIYDIEDELSYSTVLDDDIKRMEYNIGTMTK
jgi:transcription initiation factor TFIIIB Brf1 subunit/transcription initiation factor TFIIB